jgi:hypothetical protein
VTKFAGNSMQKWSLISTLNVLSLPTMFNLLVKTVDLFHKEVFLLYVLLLRYFNMNTLNYLL